LSTACHGWCTDLL